MTATNDIHPDTPANRVIKAFGGCRPLARRLGLNHSWVVRWRKPDFEGGTGGLIPSRHHREILAAAREDGIRLKPADLIGEWMD